MPRTQAPAAGQGSGDAEAATAGAGAAEGEVADADVGGAHVVNTGSHAGRGSVVGHGKLLW
jgi:hypothetical protein